MDQKTKSTMLAIGIIGTLGVALMAYVYFAMIAPEITEKKTQTAKAQTDEKKAKDEIARLERIIRETKDKEGALKVLVERAEMRLPKEGEQVEFLEILREALIKTGVSFSKITPLSGVPRGTRRYLELPYDIAGNARYHDFGQFVNIIECHPQRFMRVTNFELKINDKRPSIHSVKIKVATYSYSR